MLKHPFRYIVVLIALAVLSYALVRVFLEDDGMKIQRAVYAAVVGVEKNDPSRYGRILSDSYRDDDGRDKAGILSIVARTFRDYKPFRVEIKGLKVDTEGVQAETLISYRCYFKKDGAGEKVYYDAGKINAFWQKESSGWKIVRIEYTSSSEILFLPAVA